MQGWSKDQTITLVWINQSLLMTVYLWGWWEVTRNIQSGAIVTELLKPYDYFTYWLSRDLGRALAHFLIRGIPTFTIGALLFDVLAPQSLARGVAFVFSVALAVVASFCLRFLFNVAGFWVLDYRGIAMLIRRGHQHPVRHAGAARLPPDADAHRRQHPSLSRGDHEPERDLPRSGPHLGRAWVSNWRGLWRSRSQRGGS